MEVIINSPDIDKTNLPVYIKKKSLQEILIEKGIISQADLDAVKL